MAHLARSQARYCARVKKLVHSNRFALKGGENLACGSGSFSARAIVKSWMTSPPHKAWLLDARVRSAGVGIARNKNNTYAAWAFSDQPFSLPLTIKQFKIKVPLFSSLHINRNRKNTRGIGMLRIPVKIVIIVAALISIILGVHGVWVYFSRLEVLFGGNSEKLFLGIELPQRLEPMISWMSMKGFQSWVIPVVFILVGLALWGLQSNIYVGDKFRWLKKLHLW